MTKTKNLKRQVIYWSTCVFMKIYLWWKYQPGRRVGATVSEVFSGVFSVRVAQKLFHSTVCVVKGNSTELKHPCVYRCCACENSVWTHCSCSSSLSVHTFCKKEGTWQFWSLAVLNLMRLLGMHLTQLRLWCVCVMRKTWYDPEFCALSMNRQLTQTHVALHFLSAGCFWGTAEFLFEWADFLFSELRFLSLFLSVSHMMFVVWLVPQSTPVEEKTPDSVLQRRHLLS